jgi:hypothetical protein
VSDTYPMRVTSHLCLFCGKGKPCAVAGRDDNSICDDCAEAALALIRLEALTRQLGQ